jgi:hypothetical protein
MRGGVSLAVWMGGACREIAALRAARSEEPKTACDRVQQKIYEFLLKRCGYDTVTIDILTGTSAGGLNGVLFATHLMYGTPFNSEIRDIWLQLGDLEGLSREPDTETPDSLLLGTKGFYAKVLEQLRRLVPPDEATRKARRPRLLRLILTATRLHPRNEYLRTSIGTPMLVNWSRAHMVFRHRESGAAKTFTDFPDSPADRDAALSRLAYAARTTSSFPAAFEPAEVEVVRNAGSERHNFYGLISETCSPDLGSEGCVQLMDGGILDNVPLAWAVRAIADAPADQAVDRWLLYLEPVPAMLPEPPKKGKRSLARLAGVIVALLQAKASESLLEDATELREAWTTAQKLEGMTSGIPGDPPRGALPVVDRGSYARAVVRVDADRLARLIEDPISLLGPDPLSFPDTSTFADNEQWPLLTALRGEVDPSLVDTGSSFRSPFAGARAVALVLDWIRAAEARMGASVPGLEEPRNNLYRARFACEVLVAARDRLLLRLGDPSLDDVDGWVTAADRWLRWFVELEGGLRDFAADRLAAIADRATSRGTLSGNPPEFSGSITASIWDHVADQCLLIGKALADAGAGGTPGFRALAEADDKAAVIRALTHAELVLGPLRPDPLAEPTHIRLHTINAAADSTIVPDLPTDPKERTNAKLSGNTLMNFASFLSARWRLNDWTWGRMDAASALVDVVAARGGFNSATLREELRDLYDELARIDPRLPALAGEFPPEGELDGDAVPGLLKQWLQWNIIREEVPLLKTLSKMRGGGDPPMRPREKEKAKKIAVAATITRADLKVLLQVGGESVRDLLTRSSLRRTAMRLGLVAWRAVQPAGRGWARLVHGVFAALKPLVLPPILIGFLAPVASMVASALGWITLTVATDSWFSRPGHVLVILGALVASACAIWRWLPKREKFWPTVFAALRGLVTVGVAAGGAYLWLRYGVDLLHLTWLRPLVVVALTVVAVMTSLWSVTEPWRSAVIGMASGLFAGVVVHAFDQPLNGGGAVLALYGALVVETALLTRWFPKVPG